MSARAIRSIVLPFLIAIFAIGFFMPLAVHAQSECDTMVVDGASVFGSSLTRVQSAAQDLERAGADVRVRTIQSYGSAGNLDNYAAQLERQCASWRAPDGGRKNNLVVVIISISQRKTGIYYGEQWRKTLDANWTRIQTDFMNPRFRDGDFAGGFVNGLKEITRLVELQVSPPVQNQPPQVVVQQSPAQSVVQQPSTSSGSSGFWKIFVLVIVGIPVLLVGGFFFLRFMSANRKAEQDRRSARENASRIKQEAGALIDGLSERMQLLEIRIGGLNSKVSEDDMRPISEELTSAKKLFESMKVRYGDAANSGGDPDRDRASKEEYDTVRYEYEAVLKELREVEKILFAEDGVEGKMQSLARIVSDAPEKISAVRQTYGEGILQVAGVREGGFKTHAAEELLAQANALLGEVDSAYARKEFGRAMSYVNEAKDIVSRALAGAQSLQQKKQEAEEGLRALPLRIENVKQAIEDGRPIFERISAEYAESSWESIRGNGTEAENRANWAYEAIDAVREASTMETQEWDKAFALLKEANGWLDEAESFIRSIVARESHIQAAKNDALNEIAAAKSDIVNAWDYIRTYSKDIKEENLEGDLRQAEGLVNEAESELQSKKPDFPKVVKLAKQANETADRILETARSEHDAMERLRAKTATTLREAHRGVSKAEEYIEDHSYDVGSTAKSDLREAQRYLAEAEAAADLQTKITQGEKAKEEAERAYSRAWRDVSDAEDKRRREREAQEEALRAAAYSASSHGHDWGSSSSGGGWSSGGGNSGGGGSSGWGSSGSGGGGSTGW